MKSTAAILLLFALVLSMEAKSVTFRSEVKEQGSNRETDLAPATLKKEDVETGLRNVLSLLVDLERELMDKVGTIQRKRELICTATVSRFCV